MSTQRHSREIVGDVTDGCRVLGGPVLYPSYVRIPILLALLIVTVLPATAQGPESYGLPHLFALPTATTTRQFGMGGMTSCVEDIGFPNPAFAGMLELSKAAVRISCTDFDGGLKLTGTQAWYATPIAEDQGIQLLGFRLDSDRGAVMTPAGELPGTFEETDLAVHYGRRLSDTWLVGAGVSPILETDSKLFNPQTGAVLSFSESEAEIGFRAGALYQYAEEGYAGFVLDWYTEDVTYQAPPMPQPQHFDFTSTEWALGVSGRLCENVLGAIEWMSLKSEDDDLESKAEGLHFGLEYDAAPGVAVRAGSNDGELTLGAGYSRDGWVFNYAYLQDWNDDAVGTALGGSETHQLEIGGYW